MHSTACFRLFFILKIMAKETNIDAMKYRKSTHLAGVDVQTIVAEKGKCTLTIKEVYYNTNVDVSGNKTNGYFCEFKEGQKPMVLNSTNRKILTKIVKAIKQLSDVDSRNIGNWSDVQIDLLFNPNIKMMGQVTGGIVIAENYELPTLTANSDAFNKCRIAYLKDANNLDLIKRKYKVSNEVLTLLTAVENGNQSK